MFRRESRIENMLGEVDSDGAPTSWRELILIGVRSAVVTAAVVIGVGAFWPEGTNEEVPEPEPTSSTKTEAPPAHLDSDEELIHAVREAS